MKLALRIKTPAKWHARKVHGNKLQAPKLGPQPEELSYKMNYIDLHACIGRGSTKAFRSNAENRAAIVDIYRKALLKTPRHPYSAARWISRTRKTPLRDFAATQQTGNSRNQPAHEKLRDAIMRPLCTICPLHMMEYTKIVRCYHFAQYANICSLTYLVYHLVPSMSLGQAEYIAQTLTQLI